MSLQEVVDLCDGMIYMADKHRKALRQEYDEIIYATVSPQVFKMLSDWDAINYLRITHWIDVKEK